MAKQSAGLLLYRFKNEELEVLLVHPGGPFWAKKDKGAWSIPKGELNENEDTLAAAIREVKEELGVVVDGIFTPLRAVKLKSGKTIHAWALEFDFESATLTSNTFEMEWPPKSGKKQSFAEVDRAEWLNIVAARAKINEGQVPLLTELEQLLQ